MAPINLYTTKALGREWIPSPVRSPSRNAGRFGPFEAPQMNWTYENGFGPPVRPSWRSRWSKVHERITLAVTILVVLWIYLIGRSNVLAGLRSWRTAEESIDWSQFAYGTYATTPEYLCNSVMLLEALHRLGAKADRLILYDATWDYNLNSLEAGLLRKAESVYGAKLQPIEIRTIMPNILLGEGMEWATWAQSFTKLLAFNQTQYQRVLMLDSDSTVFRPMDELFLLPETSSPVAMPRAYWLPPVPGVQTPHLTSALALITPSQASFERVQVAVDERLYTDFDMEIFNTLYGSSCTVLPHRPYFLLTGELRNMDHSSFMGGKGEEWDVQRVMEETKLVHFSDFPLPKPWVSIDEGSWEAMRPRREEERMAWEWLYEDFRVRRKEVCGVEFATWEIASSDGAYEQSDAGEGVEVALADQS